MDDKRLKQILTKRAEQEIPETMDIRNKVFHHLAEEKTTLHSRAVPRLILRWAAVVAVLVLVSTGVALALRQNRVQPDPGLRVVQTENRTVQLNLTNTIPDSSKELTGLSVTVDYAYADANRVAVAYQVSGSGTDIVIYSNPTLTDTAGRAYLWLPNSGQIITENQSGTFRHEGLMSFDASGVTGDPSVLDLSLKIDIAFTTADLRASEPYAMISAGSTTFNFQVPFNPGRTVAVNQTISSSELAIELQKVVIAPSLTRLDVCLSNPTLFAVDDWLDWHTPVTLDVNGQRVLTDLRADFAGYNGTPLSPDAACRAITIPEALMQQTGTWTLTLGAFSNAISGQSVSGSWVFSF